MSEPAATKAFMVVLSPEQHRALRIIAALSNTSMKALATQMIEEATQIKVKSLGINMSPAPGK